MTAQTYPQTVRSSLLRRTILADAVVCGLGGIALLAGAGPLAAALGIPWAALLGVGLVLPPYAALLWRIGTRPTITRGTAWALIAVNLLWVVESVALLAFGWLPLTPAGWWTVALVALGVAGFAEAEYLGLRQMHQDA